MKRNSCLLKVMACAFSGIALFAPINEISAANPYLPLWEYIPDGEPYVFEDPDNPGKYRVYIYGSHDSLKSAYCGLEQVVWSAPVNDLNNWRYDGIIFESKLDANGANLNADGKGDVLFAPDITEVTTKDGKKEYYFYPNNQNGGRNGMVAKASRPDGPFVVCNWSKQSPKETDGVLRFDPAVFVDDDGKVYGYWGFEKSFGAELDPNTMATVKPGTKIVEDMVSSRDQAGEFRFFEASSMRKIKDKYVFIYSRWTGDGEFGLPGTNYTLAYAYSDNPLGPFTYGGTIIDGRARGLDEKGNVIPTATPFGTTHGSIAEIEGKWYVFYHRQSGRDEYARQAMVAPIEVSVEGGPGGKVKISEAEYTSEGFETEGLDPFKRYSVGIMCYYTGPRPATHEYPYVHYSGSYVQPFYGDEGRFKDPYSPKYNHNAVINNTDGSTIGYKYFNFDTMDSNADLILNLKPLGIDGKIDVMIDSPWESKGGKKVGTLNISKNAPQTASDMTVKMKGIKGLKGKHPLFLIFSSPVKDKSICNLYELQFIK